MYPNAVHKGNNRTKLKSQRSVCHIIQTLYNTHACTRRSSTRERKNKQQTIEKHQQLVFRLFGSVHQKDFDYR